MSLEFSFEDGKRRGLLDGTWKFVVLGRGKLRERPSSIGFGVISKSAEPCMGTISQRSGRGVVCQEGLDILWGLYH